MPDSLTVAEQRVVDAAAAAADVYAQVIRRRVFADPARPDWLVWPGQEWPLLAETVVLPKVLDEFRRVLRANGVTDRQVVESAVGTFAVDMLQWVADSRVPDRILEQVTQAQAQDPTGALAVALTAAGVGALVVGAAAGPAVGAGAVMVWGAWAAATAVNSAVFTAGGVLASSGRVGGRKRWLSRDDERTRPTHVAADGQVQPLHQAFQVGGYPLRFPHDPLGPAAEVMNCRCVMEVF